MEFKEDFFIFVRLQKMKTFFVSVGVTLELCVTLYSKCRNKYACYYIRYFVKYVQVKA